MTPQEAAAIASAVTARISELRAVRQLYRRNRWSATWSELRKAQDAELRGLLALVRVARRAARAQGTAYPVGASYHDVQSGRSA